MFFNSADCEYYWKCENIYTLTELPSEHRERAFFTRNLANIKGVSAGSL